MNLDKLHVTDQTLQADVQALLASNPTGNLRGKRTESGIVLYFSPVKSNSTGVANFLAKLGLGALRERRMVAAEALEKIAKQTAEAEPGSRLTQLFSQGGGSFSKGVKDITAAQVEKDWGKLSPRMVALVPYFSASPLKNAHQKFRDFSDNLDAIKAASSKAHTQRSACYAALEQLMEAENYGDESKQRLDRFIADVNNGLLSEAQMGASAGPLNSSYGTAVLTVELKTAHYESQHAQLEVAKNLRKDLLDSLEKKVQEILCSVREHGAVEVDDAYEAGLRKTIAQYSRSQPMNPFGQDA